jgi:hypothetical protein
MKTRAFIVLLALALSGCARPPDVEATSRPGAPNKFEQTFSRPAWFDSIAAPEVNSSAEVSALWQSEKRCCEDPKTVLKNNRIFYKSCYNAIAAHYDDEELVVKCLWLMDGGAEKGQPEELARFLVTNFGHHRNSVDDCANCMPGDTVARVTLDLARYERAASHSSQQRAIERIENLLDSRGDEISYWVQAEIYEFLGRLYLEAGLTPDRFDRYTRAYAELNRVKEFDESVNRRLGRVESIYKAMMNAAEPVKVEVEGPER